MSFLLPAIIIYVCGAVSMAAVVCAGQHLTQFSPVEHKIVAVAQVDDVVAVQCGCGQLFVNKSMTAVRAAHGDHASLEVPS